MTSKGRPKWLPPDLRQVAELAACGLTMDQIAASLGMLVTE